MNSKQYNNVIEHTLKHEQTEDSLSTARAIFNNMGVALPQGDIKTVCETLETNNYMNWKSCTMQEAQAAADRGVAAIGISEDKIVVLSANDEEQPVTQTASVMTLNENTSAFAVDGMRYYAYSYGTTISPFSYAKKHFISVIAGEAIGANNKTQRAVAHTIMNRVKEPRDVWAKATCVSDVLIKSQYNAIDGPQYNACMEYLNNRDYSDNTYENLIQAVVPIYSRFEADFTGGAHYVFNVETSDGAAFENKLKSEPNRYIKCGPFSGISDTEYRMYRCLW